MSRDRSDCAGCPLSLEGCARAHRAAAAGAEALGRGVQGADGGQGKTLTALGSYWKGRKPLILNKACILGCLSAGDGRSQARPRDLRDADGDGRRVLRQRAASAARSRRKSWLRSRIARIADYFVVDAGRRPSGLRAGGLVESGIREGQGRLARGSARAGAAPTGGADAARGTVPRAGGRERSAPRKCMDTSTTTSGTSQRPPRHERALLPGACRAARHHALRSSPTRGGHLLRLGPDSLRGGPTRLRRLRLGPEPGGLHAHLGRVPHRRRLGGGAREARARPAERWSRRCRPRSTARRRDRRRRLAGQGIPLLRRGALPADGLDGAAAADAAW